ncbi:MAG: tetratricopeptide repeat protein, partial [Deltaproteobacteria bacterium]|nr:tetratricopeptide repeat protein [Deltaproteobacteria bacterium]
KALKKAEGEPRGGESRETLTPPAEEFISGKDSGFRSQVTLRTIVLFVVAVLALVFTVYKRLHREPASFVPPAPVSTPAQQAQSESLPVPAGAVSSGSVADLIEEGKALYNAARLDDALAKFLSASIQEPANPAPLNNIGLIYKKKNNFAQAEGYYKKALQLKPDYAECLNNLGVLKDAMGETLDAAIFLRKAVSADGTYADAYFNLAVLNDREGNFREAISNYKFFLQYTDTNDESLINKVKERIEQLSE